MYGLIRSNSDDDRCWAVPSRTATKGNGAGECSQLDWHLHHCNELRIDTGKQTPLICPLIDWLINSLMGCRIDWLVECKSKKLIDWLLYMYVFDLWSICLLIDRLNNQLVGFGRVINYRSISWLSEWLIDQLAEWLNVWPTEWQKGCIVDCWFRVECGGRLYVHHLHRTPQRILSLYVLLRTGNEEQDVRGNSWPVLPRRPPGSGGDGGISGSRRNCGWRGIGTWRSPARHP